MSAQARPRYAPTYHERLRSRSRSHRVYQDLRIPVEVVNAIAANFDEYDREIRYLKDYGGDVKATWEIVRPDYNKLHVDYPGTYRLGRFHPKAGCGSPIMSWRKEVRDAVLAYGYDQYDIAHALPSVIYHYFKDLNLPNLDAAIKDLDLNGGRPAKDVVTRVLQGCPVPNTPEHMDVMQREWYDGLALEARKIHDAMLERYPGFVMLCKAKRVKDGHFEENWMPTAIQIFYDDVESTLQMESIAALGEHCEKGKILINCDALFVPNHLQIDVLAALNVVHYDKGIKYVLKPMMQHVVIHDIDLALERVRDGVPVDAVQGVYQQWKRRFEEDNFYLEEKDAFVTINHQDKKLYFTKSESLYKSRYASDEDNVINWIKDPDRRTYKQIVNVPPPLICRATDFNMWAFSGGFRAARLPELGPDDDPEELVAPVLECFKFLVSGNVDHYDFLMKYMADNIQNPGIKRAQYVAIYGEQGVGKNELIERFFFDKIIGPDLTASYGTLAEMTVQFEDRWQTSQAVLLHEMDNRDFTGNYTFLKSITGSVSQNSNTKYGAKKKVDFYGRIYMMSNYPNAFSEDNTTARRRGLLCIASSFRSVPNALEIMAQEKVQRAFYDYLMDMDLEGWNPELDRVESETLHDANFMSAFRREPGNMMALFLHMTLDKLYEMFRKVDWDSDTAEYERRFVFPQGFICDAFYKLCNFNDDGKGFKNSHVTQMIALATKLRPGSPEKMVSSRHTRYHQYKKGDKVMKRPGFEVDYYGLKTAIHDLMEKHDIEKYVDVQSEQEVAIARLEEYHQAQLDAGWQFQPEVVHFLDVPKTKTAYRNRPGESPAYLIRQGADVIFRSDDLEAINRELGEAWVEECETETGEAVQMLHIGNTEINLGDKYMREYGKTMLELRFPAYVRDRTA